MLGLVSSVFYDYLFSPSYFFSDKLFVKVNCSDYDFSSMSTWRILAISNNCSWLVSSDCRLSYFPMQNFEKIDPRISSEVMAPVMVPR